MRMQFTFSQKHRSFDEHAVVGVRTATSILLAGELGMTATQLNPSDPVKYLEDRDFAREMVCV